MRIKIKAVDLTAPAGKKFKNLEVIYANDRGETKTWNLKDFANPATFAVLKDAKSGEEYDIATEKDAKDYTQWRSATPAGESPAGSTSSGGPSRAATSGPVKSNYETTEERAARQILIIRQSCLAQAVALNTARDDFSEADVFSTADQMVSWVMQADAVFSKAELEE